MTAGLLATERPAYAALPGSSSRHGAKHGQQDK